MAEYFSGQSEIGGKKVRWESVFPKGTRYNCERCGICCTRLDLTQKDIDLLKNRGFGEHIVYRDLITEGHASKASLRLRQNGFCEFLNDRRLCDIYELRPLVCHAYPIMPTPGFENEILVDIALRCPYVGGNKTEIKDADIQERVDGYIGYVPDIIKKALEYRYTLAEHIRSAYPVAFMTRDEKLPFMDKAVDMLASIDWTADIIGTLRDWSDKISLYSHEVIIRKDEGTYGGGKQNDEILKQVSLTEGTYDYGLSKERWNNVFSDLNNTVFLQSGSDIRPFKVSTGFRVKIGKKSYWWGNFKQLRYSKEALEELREYMKILVRRAGFQLSVAHLAEYLVDFKNTATVDYALETILIANAMAVYLDPLSKVSAVANGHDQIERSDLRAGISNMDSQFLYALTNGTIVSEFVSKIDTALGYRKIK